MSLRIDAKVRQDLVAALPSWLTVRVLVAAAWVLTQVAADELAPGGGGQEQLEHGLGAWDGAFYRDITEFGYGGLPEEALRFFPLLPLLGRVLSVATLGNEILALVIVANVAALGVGMATHRLVLDETSDATLARRATWMIAVFPGAFVMVWAYAESLMILAVIGGFIALRRKRWWWAALAGVIAALARPLGLLFVIPVLIEIVPGWRNAEDRPARIAALVGPVVGTGAYLGWVWVRFGDPLLPFSVQSQFRGDGVDPISRLLTGVGDLFGTEALGDGLHLPFALAFAVLAVLAFRFWPLSFGVYSAVVLVVALSAENLNSLERYALSAFPLALTLAVLTKHEPVERATLAIAASGVVALCSLAWVGAYVP